MPRASTLLAWADVRVGFPNALMRVVALIAFFCSIHSFLCKCGDRMERLDRHLTSEGCNTFSMAKTSGKAQCAPYYKNTITYSTSVYLPARASEQGNVIGLVSVYIYIYIYVIKKKL